jgi:hypothetical protein
MASSNLYTPQFDVMRLAQPLYKPTAEHLLKYLAIFSGSKEFKLIMLHQRRYLLMTEFF